MKDQLRRAGSDSRRFQQSVGHDYGQQEIHVDKSEMTLEVATNYYSELKLSLTGRDQFKQLYAPWQLLDKAESLIEFLNSKNADQCKPMMRDDMTRVAVLTRHRLLQRVKEDDVLPLVDSFRQFLLSLESVEQQSDHPQFSRLFEEAIAALPMFHSVDDLYVVWQTEADTIPASVDDRDLATQSRFAAIKLIETCLLNSLLKDLLFVQSQHDTERRNQSIQILNWFVLYSDADIWKRKIGGLELSAPQITAVDNANQILRSLTPAPSPAPGTSRGGGARR